MKKAAIAFSLSLVSGLALAQAPDAASKGDPVAGRLKATAICSGCHGVPGIRAAFPEVYNVPKLGGQNEGYLLSALKSYKAGDRFNQTMRAQASNLSDKEMADIAAYYAQGSAQTASK
ncbi:MAG TPA: c-type cytochrome [Usitatibacteraceae bacterium]